MNKKHFALIGYPTLHSMSPFIHKRLFAIAKIDAKYDILDIHPNDLKSYIPTLKSLDGFNITIPHKQRIIPYLNYLNKRAKLCQSVNTVKNDGDLVGYTTDPIGFKKSLEINKIKLKGNIVILGCGGAARAIAFESAYANCNITIAVRKSSIPKANILISDIRYAFPNINTNVCLLDDIPYNTELLVNATPVGMFPNINDSPISQNSLNKCQTVFDAVYNPKETLLIKYAKGLGIKAIDGIQMLIWQAVEANKIWHGYTYDINDINQLCEDTYLEMKRAFGGSVI